ncbi:MAG: T9SS type A sorting domain-containing protein [Bacteroidetes bacterium]|nr:T9SS type A sorting domain-containing protein [Bacteroidota bacterium]
MRKIFLSVLALLSFTVNSQVLVKDISPGLGNSHPHVLYPFKGNLVFAADDGFNGPQLYYSDGTASGTIMLTNLLNQSIGGNGYSFSYDLNPYTTPSTSNVGGCFTEIDSIGYLFGTDYGSSLYKLIKTDGTIAGTQYFTLPSAPGSFYATRFFKMQNYICCLYGDGSGSKILKFDPNTNSISSIPYLISHPIYDGRDPKHYWNATTPIGSPYVYNNKLYGFNFNTDSILTEDINGNVTPIKKTLGLDGGALPTSSIIVNGKYLYYSSSTNPVPSIGNEPYYYDFATNTLGLLKDVNPYFNYSSSVSFSLFPFVDNKSHNYTYFTATHQTYGTEVWITDGTSSGTSIVQDYVNGPMSGAIPPTIYHGDSCYGIIQSSGYIDTLKLITNNAISTTAVDVSQQDLYGANLFGGTGDYNWSKGNSTFFLSIANGKILNQLSGIPIYSLNPLTCPVPKVSWIPGSIMRINNNLFFSYDDCNFTGYELYKLDISLLSAVAENNSLKGKILVYPNPTNGKFTIEIEDEQKKNYEMRIYNVLGEMVSQSANLTTNQPTTLDLSFQSSGLYFLKMKSGEKIISKKLMIVK